tara:strand:- start:2755 stop:3744 length:990 start_codon:yes stop_codon:yes gene_type:complete
VKDKINIGVIGCASIAARYMIPAFIESPYFNLKFVASRDVNKAKSFSKKFECSYLNSYQDLIQDKNIQAIYMPLPTGLHYEWARKGLNAGKHLFIEKSLASNLKETREIVNLAKEKNLLVMENYMFEFHSQQKWVKQVIENDLLRLHSFNAYFAFPELSSDNFRYNKELGGGALLDAGGYVIKALKVFFPEYKTEYVSSNLNYLKNGVDIGGTANFMLSNNINNISTNLFFGFDHEYRCGIEIWGSGGFLRTNRTFTAPPLFEPKASLKIKNNLKNYTLDQDNHFLKIINHFANLINSGNFSEKYSDIEYQAKLQEIIREKSIKIEIRN